MRWFKHDTDAAQDAKIRKLLLKHGAVGYAVYFHCLELIAGAVDETKATFELEHDSELIADTLKINGDGSQSGMEKVEVIMRTILDLGLFEQSNNKIFCLKLAKRLDQSMTSNPKTRKLIAQAKENHDGVMTRHDGVMDHHARLEEIRVEESRKEQKKKNTAASAATATRPKRKPDLKLGEFGNVRLTSEEYQRLCEEHTKDVADGAIQLLSMWKEEKGRVVKNDNLALRRWAIDADLERRNRRGSNGGAAPSKPKIDWEAYHQEITGGEG